MKKESNKTKYLEWIFLLVCFVGIHFLVKEFSLSKDLKPETTSEQIIMWVGIFLMMFIVLGMHELGHLITGLVNGFQFQLFVVGPLGIRREGEHIEVYLNKNLSYYGGIAATSPVDDNPQNAKKYAYILLAGPMASILFTIICFGLSYIVGRPLAIVFYIGAFISFAIFLVTTIPSRTGMFFTDRKRFQRLVTSGKAQDVELAMLRIMGKTSMDKSYKGVQKEDIDLMVEDELPFMQYFGLFNRMCYQFEMDGAVDNETIEAYQNVSEQMSKNMVLAFDKEFANFKDALSA